MSLIAPKTPEARRRAGVITTAAGLVLVLWGVFHILGPVGDLQRASSGRVGYDAVKVVVHAAFLGGLWRAGLGTLVLLRGLKLLTDTVPRTQPPIGD